MKKFIAIIVSALALFSSSVICGCGNNASGKKSIVVTVFPEYDWVMNILGDKKEEFDVTLLLDSGADLHSYQPSVKDIATLSACDLFVYVGGESDAWVDKALKNATNKDMKVINLLETLGDKAREEEEREGMQEEDHDHDHEEDEEIEYDEHVWLSLKNAKLFVTEISNAVKTLDGENADIYSSNANSYIERLDDLDGKYAAAVNNANRDTILFGDRFPFLYLVKDYGLNYYAAFKGCSAATEVSPATLYFLKEKINELDIKVILVLESSDKKIANAIKNETNTKDQEIVVVDSLQSANEREYANGRNYLNIMESNLISLKKALA